MDLSTGEGRTFCLLLDIDSRFFQHRIMYVFAILATVSPLAALTISATE